jgi:para-aminobenzoate synthetase component 1
MPDDRVAPLVEELVPPPDPVRCCELLDGLPYRLFLDSASRDTRLGQHSFLAADPVVVVRSKGPRTEWIDPAAGTRRRVASDPLAAVRGFLAPFASPAVPGLPPFQGGAAGYVAYDWGLELERLPAPPHDDLALDDVVLGVYDWVLAWDHAASRAWLISTGMPETSPANRVRRAAARAAGVRARLRASSAVARHSTRQDPPTPCAAPAASYPVDCGWWDPRIALRSSFTHQGYLKAVERVREYIFAGDIFQANLSQRFETPLTEPAWALYRRLRVCNPAPFAAFLDLPETAVLSASPERFLRVDAAGRVETRPIKGTRPRGVGPEHDAALGQALTESPKDRGKT